MPGTSTRTVRKGCTSRFGALFVGAIEWKNNILVNATIHTRPRRENAKLDVRGQLRARSIYSSRNMVRNSASQRQQAKRGRAAQRATSKKDQTAEYCCCCLCYCPLLLLSTTYRSSNALTPPSAEASSADFWSRRHVDTPVSRLLSQQGGNDHLPFCCCCLQAALRTRCDSAAFPCSWYNNAEVSSHRTNVDQSTSFAVTGTDNRVPRYRAFERRRHTARHTPRAAQASDEHRDLSEHRHTRPFAFNASETERGTASQHG